MVTPRSTWLDLLTRSLRSWSESFTPILSQALSTSRALCGVMPAFFNASMTSACLSASLGLPPPPSLLLLLLLLLLSARRREESGRPAREPL